MNTIRVLSARLRGFHGNTVGASQVEYIVLLAVVITGTIPAVMYLETAIHETFDQTSQIFNLDPPKNDDENVALAVHPAEATTTGRGERVVISLIATLLLMSIGGLVCWSMGKRSSKRNVKEKPDHLDEAMALAQADLVFEKRQAIYQILVGDLNALFDNRVEVSQLMSRKIISVSPTDGVPTVAALMKDKHLRHVLVCKKDQLVGIISDRDISRAEMKMRQDADHRVLKASDIMTAKPLSVEPTSLASPAVTMLVKNKISCLPVVEDGQVRGILTTTDLLFAFQGILQSLQKTASDYPRDASKTHIEEGAVA